MEAGGPQVDAFLLDWITSGPVKRKWFFEQRDGNCRGMASLCGSPLLASSHSCSSNCLRRLSWASGVWFSISKGTLKFVAQYVRTATAGTVPSHWTILRLRFCVVESGLGHTEQFCFDLPARFRPD